MAEAAMPGANCTSGAIWGSVSCSRILQHAAQLSPELGWTSKLPISSWRALPAELQPVSILLSHLKIFTFRTLMMLSFLSFRFISQDARREYVLFCVLGSHVCTWCFLRKEVIYQFYQQKKYKQGISKLTQDGWSSTCFFDRREQRNNGDITSVGHVTFKK